MSSDLKCSTMRSTSCGSSRAVERLDGQAEVSRTISAGLRSTQGISVRAPRQNFENRHRNAGSQVTPDRADHLQLGSARPLGDEAGHLALKPWDWLV